MRHPHPAGSPTTAEIFKLKAEGNTALRKAYASSDREGRAAILASLATQALPYPRKIEQTATWREAEWFVSARQLCQVFERLQSAPALGGVPNALVAAEGWTWVGFKGGSEFGVLNLSAVGILPDGRAACAVVTANGNAAQPFERIGLLFSSLWRSLERADPRSAASPGAPVQ
ncbi:MAG: hypothetical protein AAGE90_07310 [Pseudomonadota bacterium]